MRDTATGSTIRLTRGCPGPFPPLTASTSVVRGSLQPVCGKICLKRKSALGRWYWPIATRQMKQATATSLELNDFSPVNVVTPSEGMPNGQQQKPK